MEAKAPTPFIERLNREHLTSLPFEDTADFADADRGFIGALEPCRITAADGRVVWDNDAYSFLSGDAPASVHPSLWRQSQLVAKQGLYEVIVARAVARGEPVSMHGASVANEVSSALFFNHVAMGGGAIDSDFVLHVVDDVILPLLRC